MKEYKVVTGDARYLDDAIKQLTDNVKYEIKYHGLMPFGGVSVSAYKMGYDTWYCVAQAMYKQP